MKGTISYLRCYQFLCVIKSQTCVLNLGLHTYKMFENPKYRSAFNLTNKIAKMHDDVSSIRFIEVIRLL